VGLQQERPRQYASLPPEHGESASRLRPVTFYEFQSGELRGYLRGTGPCPGIQITEAGEKGAITPPGGSLMSLTHYLSASHAAPEAPRKTPGRTEEVRGNTLVVRFPATQDWPLEALVSYRVGDEGRIDAGFAFHFSQPLAGFEAQVTSTFLHGSGVPHLHVGGDWLRPALGEKEISFFARDAAAAMLIEDGRWDFCLARGYRVLLDERGYDYPLLVHMEEKSGWALVQMLLTEECPSISVCSSPAQLNFSLLGRQARAGERVSCHARLAYGRFRGLEGILPLYHQFVREVREGYFALPE